MITKKKCIIFWSNLFQEHILHKAYSISPFSHKSLKPPWKILFFGTDNFSLTSLSALLKEYRQGELIKNLEVCTSVKKLKNEVHKFAERENLKVWPWPLEIKQTDFDLGLVVSFGHLIPKRVIEKFPLGIINVHASLLPRWRGAAPIIYSLANGDSLTGVTIMQIEPLKFDVGKIISQKQIEVPDDMYMPELSNKLGSLGSIELIECLKNLPGRLANAKPQPEMGISYAPKVKPHFAQIDWKNMTSVQIFNLERALKSFLPLTSTWNGEIIRLYNVRKLENGCEMKNSPGFVSYDDKSRVLKVVCSDSKYVTIDKVQLFEKRVISAKDFNNGYLKKTSIEQRYFN